MSISEKQLNALKKIRGDWGGVKPYTRIIENKKKYNRKEKHKKDYRNFSEN
jgi:hypothetical protein